MGNSERAGSFRKPWMGVSSRGQGIAPELPWRGWGSRELVPAVSLRGPGEVTCPLRASVSSAQRVMASLAPKHLGGELTWGGCHPERKEL